jgi:hypothetical protein
MTDRKGVAGIVSQWSRAAALDVTTRAREACEALVLAWKVTAFQGDILVFV